jgi:hypothetical protein
VRLTGKKDCSLPEEPVEKLPAPDIDLTVPEASLSIET